MILKNQKIVKSKSKPQNHKKNKLYFIILFYSISVKKKNSPRCEILPPTKQHWFQSSKVRKNKKQNRHISILGFQCVTIAHEY
jgi:hypothetical protein